MLEASHLTKKFDSGEVALDNLSLTVAPGEIFCLLGAPGAGKTTAVRLFLGFLRPTSGTTRVGGVDVDADPMGARQKSAYIPERFNLYPELTGLENLGYCVELAGRGNRPTAELRALLLQVGLPEEAVRRPASTYSAGMRQQVGFAVALAKRAEVLILDEPTACLDPTAAEEFLGLVRQFAARGGVVLLATRDPLRARQIGTRLGILRQGRLLTIMKTAEIADPNQEWLYREYVQP